MLKESEEILFRHPLKTARAERLIVIKDGCEKVLADLHSLVERYKSLGTNSKRTWDRMKWGYEDIADIRSRLISSTTMLNAFISTSESSVESKLDDFIKEYRQGRRESSIISLQTVDSLSADDKALWRTIRKELEEIGISVAAFDTNREFIFDWFIRAVETGAFEEQGEPDMDEENNLSEEQTSPSNDGRVNEDAGQKTRHTQYKSSTDIRQERPFAQPHSLIATPVAEPHSPERGPKKSREMVASPKVLIRDNTRLPRIAAFLAVVSRPRRRLLRAVETKDFPKAFKILSDETSSKHLDPKTLGKTLLSISLLEGLGTSDHLSLMSDLIARGANVDYENPHLPGQTSLWNSVARNSVVVVRLLIEKGADINYHHLEEQHVFYSANFFVAKFFAPQLALKKHTEILRLLLSAGADASALYNTPLMDTPLMDPHDRPDFIRVNLLHEAARLGAIPAIEVLIDHGAEIDLLSPSYGTALMAALLRGRENTVEILLARGANPNINIIPEKLIDPELPYTAKRSRIPLYQTPIEAAIVGGKLSLVKLLLKSGVLPSRSTLDFAFNVWRREAQHVPPHGVFNDWLILDIWGARMLGINEIRQDDEIVNVLEEALKHQKH